LALLSQVVKKEKLQKNKAAGKHNLSTQLFNKKRRFAPSQKNTRGEAQLISCAHKG
jgi:hypothetical protein